MGTISRHLLSQSAGDGQVHGYAYKPLAANGTGPLPHEPGHFSYALPNLDVTSVILSPIPEPDQLPHSPVSVIRLNYRDVPSDDELLDLADRSPSAHSERHYLRASTSSWDGQLVASVYVNLALQGHYLRVIMRPSPRSIVVVTMRQFRRGPTVTPPGPMPTVTSESRRWR